VLLVDESVGYYGSAEACLLGVVAPKVSRTGPSGTLDGPHNVDRVAHQLE